MTTANESKQVVLTSDSLKADITTERDWAVNDSVRSIGPEPVFQWDGGARDHLSWRRILTDGRGVYCRRTCTVTAAPYDGDSAAAAIAPSLPASRHHHHGRLANPAAPSACGSTCLERLYILRETNVR